MDDEVQPQRNDTAQNNTGFAIVIKGLGEYDHDSWHDAIDDNLKEMQMEWDFGILLCFIKYESIASK